MTEATRHTSIQTSLQSMAAFTDAQVVINDNSVLDGQGSALANAVYAIIYSSDEFSSVQESKTPQTRWDIPVMIVVAFVDWETSMNAFTTLRDAVLAEFNSTSEANRCGDGVYISEIRSESPIEGIFDAFIDFDQDSVPDYLSQRVIFVTEEY